MPSPIEITFLGTGAAIPTLSRNHPAILFKRKGESFLFDCGESAQLGLERARTSPMKISRIFITHWHADHFAGLLPLVETLHMQGRKDPLYVYGPDASRFVDCLVELSYWGIGFEVVPVDCNSSKVVHETHDYAISSIPVKHNVPAVGYIFEEKPHENIDMRKAKALGLSPGPEFRELRERGSVLVRGRRVAMKDVVRTTPGRKIAYSGDTIAFKGFFRAVQGADLVIHDGTFMEPIATKSHPSVKDVASLSKQYKIKKLVLTHLSRRYKDSREIGKAARKVFRNSIVAEDGMRLVL